MARSAASPAAASAFCHSESTRAQPSACVVIIYDLHSSYRAIGESVRAPASWPVWRTARGGRARASSLRTRAAPGLRPCAAESRPARSEEHTSELQSHSDLVCRLLLEKKKK